MKRTELKRGKPLNRGSKELARTGRLVTRTRVRPRSPKRLKAMVGRRALVAQMLAAFPGCAVPRCGQASVDVHELFPRGRGGDFLDPTNCACLCRAHHTYITDHPLEAEATGWSVKTGGVVPNYSGPRVLPLRPGFTPPAEEPTR